MPEKLPSIIQPEADGGAKRLKGKVAGKIGDGYADIIEEEERQFDATEDEPSAEEQAELSHEELAKRRAMNEGKTMAEFAAHREEEKHAKAKK